MLGETKFEITVDAKEAAVIKDLLETLEDCPIPLGDHEYVSIFRAIVDRDEDVDDVGGVEISYEEDDLETMEVIE